jgi:hypothetical protein
LSADCKISIVNLYDIPLTKVVEEFRFLKGVAAVESHIALLLEIDQPFKPPEFEKLQAVVPEGKSPSTTSSGPKAV